VIDNQSTLPEVLEYFKNLEAENEKVRVLKYDAPFNFSAINNFAAKQATGEFFCLLNDDTEIISRDWLTEMTSHACRKEIGIVGAKLYYTDDTMQHAGVIIGLGGLAGHILRFHPRHSNQKFVETQLTQSFSAVTAACVVLRKEVFEEVGGLNETDLKVAYNDIDLCLRIVERGYRVLWTPDAELYHHESISRGDDMDKKNLPRFKKESGYFKENWQHFINYDPFYNPNLSLDGETRRIALESRYDQMS
jgi:GT2 family glycosyltransferase